MMQSEEKSTRESFSSSAEFKSASPVNSPDAGVATEASNAFNDGRLIASSHISQTVTVRITTRPAKTLQRSTE